LVVSGIFRIFVKHKNKNKMIKFLKKYKEQIFNIITIFLILEFAIYPGLTTANTFYNIMAGIGLLLLIVWGGLALYNYVRSDNGGIVDMNELKEAETELDYIPKPKTKRKPKVTKSEFPIEPHTKTIKKSVTKKTK
jgi:hypothetical protein